MTRTHDSVKVRAFLVHSSHYLIRRDFTQGISLSMEVLPAHPSFKDKIRVIAEKREGTGRQKAAA